MDDFVRTCRYGHGPLEKEADVWRLPCFQLDEDIEDRDPFEMPDDVVYTVRLWRCLKCGYVEMTDADWTK